MDHLSFLLLLICTVSSLSVPIQQYYPPGWQEAPGSLDEFPVREIACQTMTVIDPWIYPQRMGIYKLMLQHTQQYFTSWGYNNTGNLLWGLPLQLGWQMITGRLHDMAGSRHCRVNAYPCVSPNSWWADMNYYLSVVPFLGALNAGVFSPLKYPVYIVKPTVVSDKVKQKFCTSVEECSVKHGDLIQDWTEFFERVKDASSQSPSVDRETTVPLMWKAHTTSIHNALPLFKQEVDLLSKPERTFAESWALFVEFIAATHFETNLINTAVQQYTLPSRLLKADDKAPLIQDFSDAQNNGIFAMNLFYSTNTNTGGRLLKCWRQAMSSQEGRAFGSVLLVDTLDDPWIIPRQLVNCSGPLNVNTLAESRAK